MVGKTVSASNLLDPDRYLKRRGRRWHYVRRVPVHVAAFDPRGTIQLSLRTTSYEVARIKRDALEKADDFFWSGLAEGQKETADFAYASSKARALALGFEYLSSAHIAQTQPLENILRRIEKTKESRGEDAPALLGAHKQPHLRVRAAMEFYFDTMAADEAHGMSPRQLSSWKKTKRQAAESFISVVANKPLLEITRADAQRYYEHWLDRINGANSGKPITPNAANRCLGNMRKLFRTYAQWLAVETKNPFDGLSFRDRKGSRRVVPPV